MRVATSSLYQPGRAPSLKSGLSSAANPSANAGVLATVLNMLGTTPRCFSRASYSAPSSGGTCSRSSIGIRLLASFPATLKRPTQGELDEARCADGGDNLAERAVRWIGKIRFDVRIRRVPEVRVIPDVEEVSRKAEGLPLRQAEVFQQGKIPVLLEWPAINVPPQVPEGRGAEIVVV